MRRRLRRVWFLNERSDPPPCFILRGSMKITDHHDGYGLNDRIEIESGDVSMQGANGITEVPHRFEFRIPTTPGNNDGLEIDSELGFLQFQNGPRDQGGSTPGLTSDAVIHALLAYLRAANKAFPSKETACAITHLEEAAHWLHARARERARRGVLGQAKA